MRSQFQELQQTWETLGRDDPLWAVASANDKRRGRWDVAEFYQSGERDVAAMHAVLQSRAAAPLRFRHILDFGCGVGRLARAWGTRADRVTGVDISESMVRAGRLHVVAFPNVELVVNHEPHLGRWQEGTFDLVFSYICLQHIPWPIASRYLAEFSRVCARDGWVAFQLPARTLRADWPARIRRALVDHAPFGIGAAYRRWRHGTKAAFEMHFTPAATVEATCSGVGLRLVHKESNRAAGRNTEGYFYVFRKEATGMAATPGKTGQPAPHR